MNKQSREELKRLAKIAQIGAFNSSMFRNSANPAAIQSLLAEFDRLEAQRDRLLSACKAGLEVVTEAANTFGPCDHDVGICVCGENRVAFDMAKAITEAESQS